MPQQAIERFIGCNASAFTPQTIVRLRNVYTTIDEGRATVADYFDVQEPNTAQPDAKNPPSETGPGNDNSPRKVSMDDL